MKASPWYSAGNCVPERRRVRLDREGGRLDAGAVEPRVFGIRPAREVALWPAVPFAVLENVQVLGRDVVPKVVAVVVVGPELRGGRIEGEAHRVAQHGRERVR